MILVVNIIVTLITTPLLGGSWVVISGVISRVTVTITHIVGLITPFVTTHEPPSRNYKNLRAKRRVVDLRSVQQVEHRGGPSGNFQCRLYYRFRCGV